MIELRNALYKNVNIINIFLQLTNFTFCNGSGENAPGCKDKAGKHIQIGLVVKSRKGKAPKERKDDDDDKYGDNKGKQHNTIIIIVIAISLLTSIPGIWLPPIS